MIDLETVQDEFTQFVDKYERTERVLLKEKHTKNVAQFSYKISKWFAEDKNNSKLVEQAGGKENFVKLATTIGWLHDLGRFEQAKIYNNFNDRQTFDHAKVGVQILKKDNYISKYCDEEKFYNTIINAVYNHNKLEIEPEMNEFDLVQCKIVRDADKLDILRLYDERLINSEKEEDKNRKTNQKIIEDLLLKKTIKKEDKKTVLDDYLLALGFVYDMNYLKSFEILKELNYLNLIIDRMNELVTDEEKSELEKVRKVVNECMEVKLNSKEQSKKGIIKDDEER